ncbi:hypothetical protein [Leptospira fletcheri]|uniref:hypothetical protein n=1 Tax=Leptospira fletcheri TaxID=2484981 RepID=UPI001438364A|nr:hypothetical protein [Leptospira fletcheri]
MSIQTESNSLSSQIEPTGVDTMYFVSKWAAACQILERDNFYDAECFGEILENDFDRFQ